MKKMHSAEIMAKTSDMIRSLSDKDRIKFIKEYAEKNDIKAKKLELKYILKRINLMAHIGAVRYSTPVSYLASGYVIKKLSKLGYNIEIDVDNDDIIISWN